MKPKFIIILLIFLAPVAVYALKKLNFFTWVRTSFPKLFLKSVKLAIKAWFLITYGHVILMVWAAKWAWKNDLQAP